jgi:hypothetical protein
MFRRRRTPPDHVLEAVIRRTYAAHAAAGRPRPTERELHAAAGLERRCQRLMYLARDLRAAGELPDLPYRDHRPMATRPEAEAALAECRAEAAEARDRARREGAAAAGESPPRDEWRELVAAHDKRMRALRKWARGEGDRDGRPE